MNTGRCLWCGDPLELTSRADRRTCSDTCRQYQSRARRAGRPAVRAHRARGGAFGSRKAHLPTHAASRDNRGSQP
jgi:hypothetical protein